MIPVPTGVRVWLATGHTDMRRGFPSLSLQVQEVLRQDPLSGHLFCFRGRKGDLLKVIWHDGQGACLFTNDLHSYYIPFMFSWGAYFRYGNSTQQFKQLDAYVFERVAHFIARKYKTRTWRRGMVDLIDSRTKLGIYRLAGTVRYATAQASR